MLKSMRWLAWLFAGIGLAGAIGLAPTDVKPWLVWAAALITIFGLGSVLDIRARHRNLLWLSIILLQILIALYALLALRPDLFPQHIWYDFIEQRDVTLRLTDESMVKVETWEIEGRAQSTLFVHPAATGNATLVYPVMIRPGTAFSSEIAIAPGAWALTGDGVTFSLFVEDRTGIRLLYSRYVDPKHHQQDQRWIPVRVDLTPYSGEIVRLILAVSSGPAGDNRNDWAGWGAPRLTQPGKP